MTGAFIETVQVLAADANAISESLRTRPVRAQIMSGLLTKDGAVTPIPWPRCAHDNCAVSDEWTLKLAPAVPTSASAPVHLHVELYPPPGSSAAPRTAEFDTPNQTPAVVQFSLAPAPGEPRLVITPYLLSSRDDMGKLLECKRAQRSATSGSTSTR